MRTAFTIFGTRMTLALFGAAMFLPMVAMSAGSTSYTLHSNFDGDAAENVGVSTSYTMTDGQLTWNEQPLASTSYQIVQITTADSASSSSSSVSSGGGTGGSGGAGGGGTDPGNRRPRPSSSSSTSSSTSSSIGRPSAPRTPDEIDVPDVFENLSSSIASSRSASGVGAKGYTFFDAVDETPCVIEATLHRSAERKASWPILFIVLALILGSAWLYDIRNEKKLRITVRSASGAKTRKKLLTIVTLLVVLTSQMPMGDMTFAAETTPSTNVYNGRLLNSSGSPITTAVSVRFSYWRSTDYSSSDVTGTGSINTGAANYAGWSEVHTVTPNSTGHFSVTLGSVTSLPDFATMATSDLLSLYLQVEVKPSASANTAYELLDVDSSDTAVDRSGILSVPFAENANLIDQREIGTGSGNIAILGSNARLPDNVAPDGTSSGTYVIDSDNTETLNIALQFGTTLNKKLTYDVDDTIFRFNDDVEIQGNLTVTGLINGVDIDNIQSSTGALKAFSGGGLNLNVSQGTYRLNGTIYNVSTQSITMIANTTNYVFYGSGGLTKNLTGFPTDESYIPVAAVVTNAGAITNIQDRRALSSDDREQTIVNVMNPAFEKAVFQGDTTDNVGQLSISHDSTNKRNFYMWTSTRSTLQDYDIYVKIPLSADFVRWKNTSTENPLSVVYRSTSANTTDNQLDIALYDTNGSPVTLSGSTTSGASPVDLANTSWTTTNIEFSGTNTWTAGQDILVKFTVSAKSDFQIHIGGLTLRNVNLLSE